MRTYDKHRVVIDTNILVSALLNPKGRSARFLEDVFDEKYEIVVTDSIFKEYANVLSRFGFHIKSNAREFVLQWIYENALFVEVKEADYPKSEMPDPTDAPFFVAARATGALLVTGNCKHYPVTEWRTMVWELVEK